jgi:hypothetical protein
MKKSLKEDPGWKEFAEVCRPEFARCAFQDELIAACGGQEDIAWALFYHTQGSALGWLKAAIPALGNKRPGDLIQRGSGDRVRACLWRMP